MIEIYAETDIDKCRALWDYFIAPGQLTDLWDFRACFLRGFKRELFFVAAKQGDQPAGFIPLSFIREKDYYGYFPGEVWQGKTWLEQNQLAAVNRNVLDEMLGWLDKNNKRYFLRYLVHNEHLSLKSDVIDEINYLFYPEFVKFDMENYYGLFSKKSRKRIRCDVDSFYRRDLSIRTDVLEDFGIMVNMNLERFKQDSYFADERFYESFRLLRDYLHEKGWLKITTILIEGEPAAVDMGCVYNGIYTLLAGGTHQDYPGIAKVINLYHMQQACSEKYKMVDFLCGDFSWKKIFHLSTRPLYVLKNTP